MEQAQRFTFPKSERLCSQKLIDKLFGSGNTSCSAYPVRMVFTTVDEGAAAPVQVLMSVSKRHFKRAVKRNRVKRQLREAFRRHKHLLYEALQGEGAPEGRGVLMSLLWLSDDLYPSHVVEAKVRGLLLRAVDKLGHPQPAKS